MKVLFPTLLFTGILLLAGCQRETVTPNNNGNPSDTSKSVLVPDSIAGLDTATLPNLYVAFISAKSSVNPNDSALFTFKYTANYFDTLMTKVSLENDRLITGFGNSFSFLYTDAGSSRYTTTYNNPAYTYPTFEIDYFLTGGQPYYIHTFNSSYPQTAADSTLQIYYVYDVSGRLKEIFNHNNNQSPYDSTQSLFFDDRNFVYDADGNILSDEVMDSGDVYHYKTYRYEYSNKASRICVRKNMLPFSQCRLFNHSPYLFENFFKREVIRITETQTDLTGSTPVISAPIVHNYAYRYNSKGWVAEISDNVTGGSSPISFDYHFAYYSDVYFSATSSY